MQSIDNVLMLRKGLKPNDPNPDIFDVLWAKKLSAIAEKFITLTGNPLNFMTKKAKLAKSTKISFEPIQEGTGDPSPTNVRPISGRTGVEIKGCGKNLFQSIIYGANTNSSGEIVNNGTYSLAVAEVQKGQRYLNSIDGSAEVAIRGYFSEIPQKGSVTYDGSRYTSGNSFTSPIDGYVCVRIPISETKYQLELSPVGTTASPYEAYQSSNDVTISFGETVYGGTLDVEKGECVVDKQIVDMGTLSWNRTTSYANPVLYSAIDGKDNSSSSRLLSDTYTARDAAYSSASGFANAANDCQCAAARSANNQIYVRDDSYTSASAFKSAMSGHYLVYMLETPRTISLTPEEVQLLKGVNNIWIEDEGATMELTYQT